VKQLSEKRIEVDFVFGIAKKQLDEAGDLHTFLGINENVNLIPIIKNEFSEDSYATFPGVKFLKDVVNLTREANGDIDFIHHHCIPNTRDVFVPFLSWTKNIPSLYRSGGWLTNEALNRVGSSVYYDFLAYKILHRFFSVIVCNSSFLKQKIVLDGVSERKVEVIPNGIDITKFRDAEKIILSGNPKLLFVGRLEQSKGIHILVASMKLVKKRLPRAVLHVVGDGPLKENLKSYVANHGLTENVIIHGSVTNALTSYYVSADICLVPSIYETFGIVTIEAMAAGKPVIATNVGGVPENITNLENGLLITPSVMSLENAITRLWSDKELMKKIASNNLKKSINYDWSRISDRYIALYNLLLRK
jgi:glycosyltransferase involved in cell wall biosynthesis